MANKSRRPRFGTALNQQRCMTPLVLSGFESCPPFFARRLPKRPRKSADQRDVLLQMKCEGLKRCRRIRTYGDMDASYAAYRGRFCTYRTNSVDERICGAQIVVAATPTTDIAFDSAFLSMDLTTKPSPSAELAARCHDIQTGLGLTEIPEFSHLRSIGMAVKLALHIFPRPPRREL